MNITNSQLIISILFASNTTKDWAKLEFENEI